ncbi:cytochrome c oxidase subunit IV family [Schizophyllum amplum]|uniref:Cytochrome c oxidase subunit IV family n=1 Tax=Schizophyllum amplum TaxID=97359 RepID=A0A550C8Y8_9AGAR|nr:cytochrome c oxidase subunit IV family [Auriculariopsis ampla]
MHAAAAIRLARQTAARAPVRRALATAATAHADVSPSTSASTKASVIPLSNIEAQWEKMPEQDKVAVHAQLAELQKKDWKTLSIDEQKAAYYIAFGPARTPQAGLCAWGPVEDLPRVHRRAPEPPKTMTTEWQEAETERAKEQKINPITGIASEGYSGKGFVSLPSK